MSMDLGSKGSLKADINVTPLVDVMLVLLIIMDALHKAQIENIALITERKADQGGKTAGGGR